MSDRYSIRSGNSTTSTLPTLEKFVYLLKKSLNAESALSDEERSDITRVKSQLSQEQWDSFMKRAQGELIAAEALAPEERDRMERAELDLIYRQSEKLAVREPTLEQLLAEREDWRQLVTELNAQLSRTQQELLVANSRLQEQASASEQLAASTVQMQAESQRQQVQLQQSAQRIRDLESTNKLLQLEMQSGTQSESLASNSYASVVGLLSEQRNLIIHSARVLDSRAADLNRSRGSDSKELEALQSQLHQAEQWNSRLRSVLSVVAGEVKDFRQSFASLRQDALLAIDSMNETIHSFAYDFAQVWASQCMAPICDSAHANVVKLAATSARPLPRAAESTKGESITHSGVSVICRVGQALDDTPAVSVIDSHTIQLARGQEYRNLQYDAAFDYSVAVDSMLPSLISLISAATDGRNSCLLLYGSSGSGKSQSLDACVPLLISELFDRLQQKLRGAQPVVSVTAVEVSGEITRDLLASPLQAIAKPIRPDSSRLGLTAVAVSFASEAERVLMLAKSRRQHDAHSHCILTFAFGSPDGLSGRLTVVDLAPSDRQWESESTPGVAQQAMKDLSAVGTVLAALVSNQPHIPYRNTRITHVLADALSSESTVILMIHVHGGVSHYASSLATLSFGSRVLQSDTGLRSKSESEDMKLYRKTISRLRAEIARSDA